jgi:hypothetical protein
MSPFDLLSKIKQKIRNYGNKKWRRFSCATKCNILPVNSVKIAAEESPAAL